jgi:hypothetical protein
MEFYEFMEDRVLLDVSDYVPSEIIEGLVRVTVTLFGLFGEGVLNISKVKMGKVTLCRLSSTGDNYMMHMGRQSSRGGGKKLVGSLRHLSSPAWRLF